MSTHDYVYFFYFSPPGFFNGDIKDISMLITFSYFFIRFSGVLRSICVNLQFFSTGFFEDHIIPPIFLM
jgi:hypothetical protein